MSTSKYKLLSVGVLAALVMASACRSGGRSYYASSSPSPRYSGEVYAPSQPPPPPIPGPVAGGAPPGGKTFQTPQDAMNAVAEVAGTHDQPKVEEIFGPGATEVLWSGDDVADREAALRVKEMIRDRVELEEQGPELVVASIGKDKWPFPIPLVRVDGGWRFDLEEGKEELLSRRIGRNELETIETMYAYVEAQKEYAATGRDGNPPAYAQKVHSTPSKHDGLYWENGANEPESPFGPLVGEAETAGYSPPAEGAEPRAFHGYRYKILKGQGANAAGGRKSYMASKGLMTGGFAGVAWPATYGNSGIMTFLVNQNGIVFQKDLGPDTERIASAITEYDPDKTWKPAPHKDIDN
jgi:hypothetical protein